jgi:hypothetical protein
MAKVKNNQFVKGISGKLGDDLVYRQVDNQTIITKRGVITGAPTSRQSTIRNRFAQATQFASVAIEHPETSVQYKLMAEVQGLKSAYLAAVTDFLTEPEISSVLTSEYKGRIGDMIIIKPKHLYKITALTVTIFKPDGSVLETGAAIAHELMWRYTTTVANANVAGSKMRFVAKDRRDKEVVLEVTV